MKKRSGYMKPSSSQQRGVGAVEFALIAIPFFLILFGVMEFARLLFIWNTVQEVTRNAARLAVVTDFSDETAKTALRKAALFNSTSLPAAGEITDSMIVIDYLNETGALTSPLPDDPTDNLAACLDPDRAASCIRTVEVCISVAPTGGSANEPPPRCATNNLISFSPMLGLFGAGQSDGLLSGIRIPLSSVQMPAESLGFTPDSL